MVDKIRRRRLSWFGHVSRMDERRLPSRALYCYIKGRRKRGRPPRNGQIITEDVKLKELSVGEAVNLTETERNGVVSWQWLTEERREREREREADVHYTSLTANRGCTSIHVYSQIGIYMHKLQMDTCPVPQLATSMSTRDKVVATKVSITSTSESRVVRGSIFGDPTKPNPSTEWSNATNPTNSKTVGS